MHEDLIKRLRELQAITEHCDEQSCGECENRELCDKHDNKTLSGTYKEAADAIDDLQKLTDAQLDIIKQYQAYLDKMRWVPVTERLPEIDEKHHCSKDVLAYLKDGGMCFTALEENIFGQACFECERNPAVEEEMIVTHWMPLPEPPKEET